MVKNADFQSLTLGEIVKADLRSANVFEKIGLDYCCGGGTPLETACRQNGLDLHRVIVELSSATKAQPALAPDYETFDPDALTLHIIDRHHAYVREQMPILQRQLQKISQKHGERHPEMTDVERLFSHLQSEMEEHMFKEEQILFPYIQALCGYARAPEGPRPQCPFGSVRNPILALEHDHRTAGRLTAEIRRLTGAYQAPPEACPTYRSALENLRAFEEDLHFHVHLENNILHPKAVALEENG